MYKIIAFAAFGFCVARGKSLFEPPALPNSDNLQKQVNGSVPSKTPIVLDQTYDTKKHYYLLKIDEYYNFLPRYLLDNEKMNENRRLHFEVDDFDYLDPHKGTGDVQTKIGDKTVAKRDTSNDEKRSETSDTIYRKRDFSDTLAEYIDFVQFAKRDVHDVPGEISDELKQLVKRDLGDFAPGQFSSADSDDPMNNNYRHIAFVPFFKVRKYYIQKKRLDLGL